jgi:hypothetical protein
MFEQKKTFYYYFFIAQTLWLFGAFIYPGIFQLAQFGFGV